MLDHIRHVLRSASYNRSSVIRPRRALSLAGAWFRNEAGYARRTSRLRTVIPVENRDLNEVLREASTVTEYCREELLKNPSLFPGFLNPAYGPVLYALVRLLRPQAVVETGVGSGVSSTYFLRAMEKNGQGQLYSIDLPLPDDRLLPPGKETGWLVPPSLAGRWELVLGDARGELPALLERLGEVDFFFHDSDHSYEHMVWEYTQAYPHIRAGGLLLSDETTSNRAWEEFTSGLDGVNTRINRTGIHRKAGK